VCPNNIFEHIKPLSTYLVMGLLSQGQPLSWQETKKNAELVRRLGIDQFIKIYHELKDRKNDCLKWGDEVEYMIVKFNDEEKKVRLSLKNEEIFKITDKWEVEQGKDRMYLWHNEYGSYMIEGTPGHPYGENTNGTISFAQFNKVEQNMKNRRKEITSLLESDEAIISLTTFPRHGCEDFTFPKHSVDLSKSLIQSIFIPERAINHSHPRFKTLSLNINARRGRKVIINIPIFKDTKTPDPFIEKYLHYHKETEQASKPNFIYMDAMSFGMGSSCLQVTFQASSLNEAKVLYDQLTPISPIMMALSAAAPIFRGYLTDIDCRWSIISQSVDDRTKQELGEEPIKFCDKYKRYEEKNSLVSVGTQVAHNPVRSCECTNNHFRIAKSRYDSISSYVSEDGDKYNDIPLTYNVDYYQKMVKAGVDNLMARHIAHLFIRDPISSFKEKLDETEGTDHFENIQSTNWQSMRLKLPVAKSGIGWRVEFRTMDLQITDFENAAYVIFVVLLTRVILTYKLNLLIPLSKVDENMKEAEKRDAVHACKFWFRKDIITQSSPPEADKCVEATGCPVNCCKKKTPCPKEEKVPDDSCELMTLNEIINGKGSEFPGLVPLLRAYLVSIEVDAETHCAVNQYLNLVSNRASGNCMTNAQWIRKKVRNHPDYKSDSIVTDRICYDLLVKMQNIVKGEESDLNDLHDLFGKHQATIDRLTKKK